MIMIGKKTKKQKKVEAEQRFPMIYARCPDAENYRSRITKQFLDSFLVNTISPNGIFSCDPYAAQNDIFRPERDENRANRFQM